MNRRPTPAGRRVLRYMADHGDVLLVQTTSTEFGLTYNQFHQLLRGLERRLLIDRTSGGWRVTQLGRDELTGAAARRRRVVFGERNGNSKLTVDDVAAIRRAYAGGALQRDLAATYGVGQNHISNVVRRLTWKDVA